MACVSFAKYLLKSLCVSQLTNTPPKSNMMELMMVVMALLVDFLQIFFILHFTYIRDAC